MQNRKNVGLGHPPRRRSSSLPNGLRTDGTAALVAPLAAPQPPPTPPEHFVFEMTNKRPLISNRALLEQVRAFGRTLGDKPFTQDQFNAWKDRRCAANCIANRFGTWRRALAAAGIHGAKALKYQPQELIENLERVWRALGRPPGTHTIQRHGSISAAAYSRHWGSLKHACSQFARFKRGDISFQDLLKGGAPGKRRALAPSVRWQVLQRDGHRCQSCGRSALEDGVKLEADHIIPVADGGTDDPSNLRALCSECNRGRGSGRPR